MTVAELFATMVTAITTAFDESKFAVWPGPPDQTAVPAVWPEFASSFTGVDRVAAAGQVAVRVVAAIAPQVHAAEYAALFDAHDRLDSIIGSALGVAIASRTGTVEVVTIGGVDHTALLYSFTLARPFPTC